VLSWLRTWVVGRLLDGRLDEVVEIRLKGVGKVGIKGGQLRLVIAKNGGHHGRLSAFGHR